MIVSVGGVVEERDDHEPRGAATIGE